MDDSELRTEASAQLSGNRLPQLPEVPCTPCRGPSVGARKAEGMSGSSRCRAAPTGVAASGLTSLLVPDEGAPVEDNTMTVDAGSPERCAFTGWRDNPAAEDLLGHRNDPTVARNALDLSRAGPAEFEAWKTAKDDLLRMFRCQGSGLDFSDIRAEDIEVIGEPGGITCRQLKGGPAGAIDIEFSWRFAGDIDTAMRARMERPGKSWSFRLLDENRTRAAPRRHPNCKQRET